MRKKPSKTVQIIGMVIVVGIILARYIDWLWFDYRWWRSVREGWGMILSGFPLISIGLGVFLIWLSRHSFELLVEKKPQSTFEGIHQLYCALGLFLGLFFGLLALVYGLFKLLYPLLKITCF